MRRVGKMCLNIFTGALVVNLVWYVAAVTLQMKALVNPLTVYSHMGSVIRQSMGIHILASTERIVAGVILATLMGVCIGLWMSKSTIANKILGSFIYFTYSIPKLALLPVVMLLAGIGDATKIIMIVLIIVFQIIIATRDAVSCIPKENYYILTSLGCNWPSMMKELIIPAILPGLFTTLRIAIGTAISVLFVTETYGTDRGMGYFIVDSWMRINYVDMYAGIVILSIIGFVLFLVIDILDALCCNWKKY